MALGDILATVRRGDNPAPIVGKSALWSAVDAKQRDRQQDLLARERMNQDLQKMSTAQKMNVYKWADEEIPVERTQPSNPKEHLSAFFKNRFGGEEPISERQKYQNVFERQGITEEMLAGQLAREQEVARLNMQEKRANVKSKMIATDIAEKTRKNVISQSDSKTKKMGIETLWKEMEWEEFSDLGAQGRRLYTEKLDVANKEWTNEILRLKSESDQLKLDFDMHPMVIKNKLLENQYKIEQLKAKKEMAQINARYLEDRLIQEKEALEQKIVHEEAQEQREIEANDYKKSQRANVEQGKQIEKEYAKGQVAKQKHDAKLFPVILKGKKQENELREQKLTGGIGSEKLQPKLKEITTLKKEIESFIVKLSPNTISSIKTMLNGSELNTNQLNYLAKILPTIEGSVNYKEGKKLGLGEKDIDNIRAQYDNIRDGETKKIFNRISELYKIQTKFRKNKAISSMAGRTLTHIYDLFNISSKGTGATIPEIKQLNTDSPVLNTFFDSRSSDENQYWADVITEFRRNPFWKELTPEQRLTKLETRTPK